MSKFCHHSLAPLMLCLGSIGMDCFIIMGQFCKPTIPLEKIHGKKNWMPQFNTTILYLNLCYNEVCYKGTALYLSFNRSNLMSRQMQRIYVPFLALQRILHIYEAGTEVPYECVTKINFLILNQNICCGYSKEPSQ